MNRRDRVVRASFYLSLALSLAAVACGDSFTAGSGDGGDDGGIVFGDGGDEHDATSNDDGSTDARHDGPRDGGTEHDGSIADGTTEAGMPGCGSGSLTCSDGGCVKEGPTNCGTCGNDCTALPHVMGAQCVAGQCSVTCVPGWENCTSNPGAGCGTDVTTQGNCGGCNVTCSGSTPVCGGAGGCVSGCMSGQTLCSSTCVDTTSNPQDCNGCGNVCPAGPPNSQPTCTNSACGWSCDSSYTQCSSSCILTAPDTVHGVFVAPGGAVTSCGAVNAPCATISAAFQYVGNGKNVVYVAQSTYVEQVTVPSGVTIQGGWVYMGAGQWSHPCAQDPSQTVIQAPAASTRAVIVSFSSGSSTLDTLTISNPNTAASGQSLYGVFAANAQAGQPSLTLTNVDVAVNAGGAGSPGGQGGQGNAPPPTCLSGDGADGGAGSAGTGALNGTYSAAGFQPAQGGQGNSGSPGDNGTAAPPKPCVDTYTGSNTTNPNCCDIANVGCGVCTGTQTNPICSSQGTNGCGSSGSPGGMGGGGGGASIGIFVWNEVVVLDDVNITTAMGGQGGQGGPAQSAAPGSAGASGAQSTQAYFSACVTSGCPNNCICKANPPLYVPGGGPGGTGGTGGTGGQGGGGAGGDSLCYYESPAGAVTASGGNCTTPPNPAPGGNGGAAAGRVGLHN